MATMNNTKELTRGDTGMYSIYLYDEEGDALVPSASDTVTFYLLGKDCDDLSTALIIKDIPTNTMKLELEPSDTASLNTGTYPYRIRYKDAVGHEFTVVKSKLKIVC